MDDEARNLEALEAMLEPTGCTCVRAQSADEALLALLRHDFAAMILDVRMPGMSGIELAKLVKQRRRNRDVPILFLTAHLVEDEDVLRGYGVGAVDYLSKPINPDILRSKISAFIELYRKNQTLAELNAALEGEIAARQRAREALQQANQELELRVRERTAELTVAHRDVRENEERLRLALEISQMAAWEWDLGIGRMTWSQDPEALFGFPPGAFGPERRLFSALHRDDRARMEAALETALITGTYEGDYRIVRPDGTMVWIRERGRAIRHDDGTVEKIVGVSRDVTAERRAAAERERLLASERRAREEAERQSRLKDEFLATLSHELRTPMNVILGWLEILSNAKGRQLRQRDLEKAIGVIRRNAQIQAKLIDDLLDMSRLASGSIQLEIASVDLGTLLQNTMDGLRPAADARQIKLLAAVPTPSLGVVGDVRRIQQIMWNLLHNAIKFSEPGGRVESTVTQLDGEAHVTVRDNGRGISPEFLPHVFERFRQENASTTREFLGLGLGLSIAKHLVEAHGGRIEAHSDGPGCGATFTVKLPIAAAQIAGAAATATERAAIAAGSSPASSERRAEL